MEKKEEKEDNQNNMSVDDNSFTSNIVTKKNDSINYIEN